MGAEGMIEAALHDIPDLDLAVGAGGGEARAAGVDGGAEGGAVGAVDAAEVRAVAWIPDRELGQIRHAAEVIGAGAKVDATEERGMARDCEDVAVQSLFQMAPLPAAQARGHFSSAAAMGRGSSVAGLMFERRRSTSLSWTG